MLWECEARCGNENDTLKLRTPGIDSSAVIKNQCSTNSPPAPFSLSLSKSFLLCGSSDPTVIAFPHPQESEQSENTASFSRWIWQS